jgi:hypothetical protein
VLNCGWNALLASWPLLLVVLVFLDGSVDLFLNFVKQHHGLLTS